MIMNLCPYLQKLLILFFFGLMFAISHYGILIILSSDIDNRLKYSSFVVGVWFIFNIIFNYVMAILVKPGTPSDIPMNLLI